MKFQFGVLFFLAGSIFTRIMYTDPSSDQTYAFWRPHAPPGFAVLGDYLMPLLVTF